MTANETKFEIGELMLGVLFLLISAYALIQSLDFGSEAATFPQMVAGLMLIGSVAVIGRIFVGEGIHQTDGNSINDMIATVTDFDALKPSTNFLFLLVLIVTYLLGAYLLGFLWMSPVFTLVYTVWQKQPWYIVGLLTVISIAIPYLIEDGLNIDLSTGVLLMGKLPVVIV